MKAIVNVSVEQLGPCKRLIRVEIDNSEVSGAFDKTLAKFQKMAKLPGFRNGKAPKSMILKKYSEEVRDEVKEELYRKAYRHAVDQEKLVVVNQLDFEEVQFEEGKPFICAITLEIQPVFDLPAYKGIKLKKFKNEVDDETVERIIKDTRNRRAKYEAVDRPAEESDFVVISYVGECEGKKLTEINPAFKTLGQSEKYWLELGKEWLAPGFNEGLIGAVVDETRQVEVTFPDDFMIEQVRNKPGKYEVKVLEVKTKVLPEMDQAFFEDLGYESLEDMTGKVRERVSEQMNKNSQEWIISQVVGHLLSGAAFELPEDLLRDKTREEMHGVIERARSGGDSDEDIEAKKEEIAAESKQRASEILKMDFLIRRIAEDENIKVSNDELNSQLYYLGLQQGVKPKKMREWVEETRVDSYMFKEILKAKTLRFIESNAEIEEVSTADLAKSQGGSAPSADS